MRNCSDQIETVTVYRLQVQTSCVTLMHIAL